MIRVTVTLRQEDLDEVDQLADKLTIPRSAAVRILIMEALEQREPQKMTIKVEQREPEEEPEEEGDDPTTGADDLLYRLGGYDGNQTMSRREDP